MNSPSAEALKGVGIRPLTLAIVDPLAERHFAEPNLAASHTAMDVEYALVRSLVLRSSRSVDTVQQFARSLGHGLCGARGLLHDDNVPHFLKPETVRAFTTDLARSVELEMPEGKRGQTFEDQARLALTELLVEHVDRLIEDNYGIPIERGTSTQSGLLE